MLKTQVDGGLVFADNGDEVVFTCADDGVADIVNFVNSSSAADADYTYVLTTDDNFVLSVLNGPTVDFEGTAGFDNLHVWGVSYSGNLTIGLGQVITEIALSDDCYSLSGNFVDVYRDQPDGGTLSVNGEDVFRLCHSNFMPGVDVDNNSNSLAGYAYFITDSMNVVLSVDASLDNNVDFNDVEPGTYRVWGISYTGDLQVVVGDTVPEVEMPASSCFEWSSNFITVERTESLDGGDISTSTGESTIHVCQGDDVSDIVILFTTSTDLLYKYVVTDTFNRVLVPDIEGNVINFDQAAAGVCRIYGVAFTGELNPGFMDDVFVDPLSDDCWALSNNYITIVRQVPEGGEVSTIDGTNDVLIVTDDGMPDEITMVNTGAELTPYAYIITDEDNVILGGTEESTIDFEGVPEGVCRIWGLSYTGEIIAELGDDADLVAISDDCFDLSDNFVTVTRVLDGFQNGGQNFSEAPDTGVEAEEIAEPELELEVWPNPVSSVLNLRMHTVENGQARQQVEVIALTGSRVIHRELAPDQAEATLQLNLEGLPSGIYFVRWHNGKETVVQRFMKQ